MIRTPDRTSGSTDVASAFLDRLARFVATDVSTNAAGLRTELLGWLRAEQAGQPSMAIIHQLCARALAIADTGVVRKVPAAELRVAIDASCDAERADLEASRRAIATLAADLVTERGGWIATLSHSRAVIDAFLAAHALGREPRAIVGEGRPGLEGRRLSAELAAAGIPVWNVADAALPLLASQASHVWIGADAVTERGVMNKIGSYAAALAARDHSVPLYVLAGRRKFLPSGTGALKIVEMPSEELWDDPPEGVRARNVYFELVPLELVRGIVVEDAVLGITETMALARDSELPAALRGE